MKLGGIVRCDQNSITPSALFTDLSHLWKLRIPDFRIRFDEDALESSHPHFVKISNQRVDEIPHTTSEVIKSFSRRAVHSGTHDYCPDSRRNTGAGERPLMTPWYPLCIDVHASIFNSGTLGDLSKMT
jgi:hypothetical protein